MRHATAKWNTSTNPARSRVTWKSVHIDKKQTMKARDSLTHRHWTTLQNRELWSKLDNIKQSNFQESKTRICSIFHEKFESSHHEWCRSQKTCQKAQKPCFCRNLGPPLCFPISTPRRGASHNIHQKWNRLHKHNQKNWQMYTHPNAKHKHLLINANVQSMNKQLLQFEQANLFATSFGFLKDMQCDRASPVHWANQECLPFKQKHLHKSCHFSFLCPASPNVGCLYIICKNASICNLLKWCLHTKCSKHKRIILN